MNLGEFSFANFVEVYHREINSEKNQLEAKQAIEKILNVRKWQTNLISLLLLILKQLIYIIH